MVEFRIEVAGSSFGGVKYKITKSKEVKEFGLVKTVSVDGETLRFTKNEIQKRLENFDALKKEYESYLVEIEKIESTKEE